VIGDAPLLLNKVGEILSPVNESGRVCCKFLFNNQKEIDISPLSYPLIFKELQWWENRKVEDMPEYVKCVKSPDNLHRKNEIYYVISYASNTECRSKLGTIILNTNCYLPATEEEYNQYIKSQVE
jgi:hypothetical protein